MLTSGNKGLDEFMGVALRMKNIGKSLIDFPHTLAELIDLHKQYQYDKDTTEDFDIDLYLQQ